jgi:hypothetical protein
MKVINFQPHQVKADTTGTKPARPIESIDFESFLAQNAQHRTKNSAQNPDAVVDKISTENKLACQGASLEDVGLAGSLLNTLVSQISGSQADTLQKIHNLDGILYYYQL